MKSTGMVRLCHCNCGHKYLAPVVLSDATPNLSGEATKWCPKCHAKPAVCDAPVKPLDLERRDASRLVEAALTLISLRNVFSEFDVVSAIEYLEQMPGEREDVEFARVIAEHLRRGMD